jgi:hypothetical protein
MSKPEKRPEPKATAPRVRVLAIVEDTAEGKPRSWAVVRGTVSADMLEVEHVIPENNATMAKAHDEAHDLVRQAAGR